MTSSLQGHHCSHLGSKTVGVDVHSTGKTGLGLNLTAFNATIRKSPTTGGYELVFDFHADVVVLVLSWNVDDVVAHNCKIKILGIGEYACTQERVTQQSIIPSNPHNLYFDPPSYIFFSRYRLVLRNP